MGCSFGSPTGIVVIRFRSSYAPQNLNLERLPEKPRSSQVYLLTPVLLFLGMRYAIRKGLVEL